MTQPNPFDGLRVTKDNMRQSVQWFQTAIKALSRSSYQPGKLLQSQRHLTLAPYSGKMYLYKYDPIHAETLRYYDTVPLIFFLNRHPDASKRRDYFYGLQLHYIAPNLRVKLLHKLYEVANNQKYDATTRLKITWKYLERLGRAQNLGLQNAIKMYKISAMRSRFLEIPPSAWPMVACLPIENFQKASKQKVWHDSKKGR